MYTTNNMINLAKYIFLSLFQNGSTGLSFKK